MQQSSQIDEPDYGTLLDDMFFAPGGHPHRALHRARGWSRTRLRPEEDAEGRSRWSWTTCWPPPDYVQPAIEIIDARIEQFDRHTKALRKVFDTISDNAANAGIVLGGRRADPRALDLPWVGAILRQNGVVEETGLAAGVQGHPAVGVAWLARKLAPWGERLEAGEVVLAGSFTRPVPAQRGDVFDADYGPLGRFTFTFT
jgi:2-oxo-hept-3-ene-1,7-dioate hydratase